MNFNKSISVGKQGVSDNIFQQTDMKKIQLFSVMALLLSLSSCQVIGGIFKAGVWAGVLLVVAVVGIIVFIISKAGGSK